MQKQVLSLLGSLFFFFFSTACNSGGGGHADGGTDEGPAFMEGSASAVIGPEGGELELGEVELHIPAGALAEDTEISVDASAMDIEGVERLSAVYMFSPSGLGFAVPATISFNLDHGAAGAQLFRGEDLGAAPQAIEADIEDGSAEAMISGFSYYVVGVAGTPDNPIIDVDDGFTVDGVHYTAGPVIQGIVGGFGYSLGDGAGVNDGEAMNGHVWYGDSFCLTFRADGSGVLDWAGGTSRRYADFPFVRIDDVPGQAETSPMILSEGMSPLGAELLDPEYDRTSELRAFNWGVRVNDDGSIYDGFNGYYETRMEFEDGSDAMTFMWDPGANGPADNFTGYGGVSTELPATQHFCRFRETVSQTADGNQSRCVQSVDEYSGATKSACYSHGVLEGPYSLTSMSGVEIESGQFASNRPVGGWSFSSREGVKRANGTFNEDGLQQGEWQSYDYEGKLAAKVSYKGNLFPSDRGTYYRTLSGAFTGYATTFDGTSYKGREGSLIDGKRSGPWYFYDETGTRTSEENYDFNTQIPNGEWCFSLAEGGVACEPITFSWKNNANYYDWGGCVNGVNTWTHNTYDMTGSVVSQECFELTGARDMPTMGASKSCGSACSQ